MRAESIGLRKYALFNDKNERIATLNYEGWLTYQATAELTDGTKINFEPQGFWGQTIEVKQEDKNLATIRMDWLSVKIFYEQEKEPMFVLKYTGFWQPKMILQDKQNNRIAEFVGRFRWSKFAYEYEITTLAENALTAEKELVITCFAAMYLFKLVSGSSGG